MMPSVTRILEILLYSLTAFLPWVLLALYPFRSRLRFSPDVIAIGAAVLAAVQITADLALGLGTAGSGLLIRLAVIVLYVCFCFLSAAASPLEIAVNTGLVLVLALVGTIAAKALAAVIAPAVSYSLANTIILLVLEIALVLLYSPLRRQLDLLLKLEAPAAEETEEVQEIAELPAEEPLPEAELPAEDPVETEPDEQAEEIPMAATIKLPRFHLSLRASSPAADRRAEALRAQELRNRLDRDRQLRQDMEKRIRTMSIQLNSKDYEGLRSSLAALQEQYVPELPACCEDPALNGLLTTGLLEARNSGIKMTVNVQLPGNLPLEEQELTLLVGSLLDNALEACRAQTGTDRRITISGNQYGQALRFVVENTYDQPVRQDRQGNYLSAKYDGPGAGLEIVHAIAARHSGTVKTDHSNGIFQITVTVNL